MERLSSTEANKKLEALQRKRQKLERELQTAKEEAIAAEEFERKAKELGAEIMNVFDVTDKKQFIRWLLQNTDKITGLQKKLTSSEADDNIDDNSNHDKAKKTEDKEKAGSGTDDKGVI